VVVDISWIPREQNTKCDDLSKAHQQINAWEYAILSNYLLIIKVTLDKTISIVYNKGKWKKV
jgi:hypothetical protein